MKFQLWYTRRMDTRRFNRQWREVRKLSEPFRLMEANVRATGDESVLPMMGDAAEECGYPMLGQVMRTGGLEVRKPKKRRKRRRQ